MSFDALPTELDVAIINYLGRSDIGRLSRCTKYFREIAEPHLYEYIRVWNHEDDRLKQLLITLVNRKDLRRKIRSLGVRQGPQQPQVSRPSHDTNISITLDGNGPALYKDLLKYPSAIGAIIAGVCAEHHLNAQLEMALFSRVFEPHPLLDGAAALIICIAAGLRALEFDFHLGQPFAMTRYLLESVNWRQSVHTVSEYPLMHISSIQLQEIRCQGTRQRVDWGTVTVPLGLHSLALNGNPHLRQISLARFRTTDSATLHNLTLKDVSFDPRMLRDFIRLPFARNIKSIALLALGLRGLSHWPARPWENYNYKKFKEIMLQHLPQLSSFIWVGMAPLQTGKGFGTFSGFTELTRLYIDQRLMSDESISFNDPQIDVDPDSLIQYFPPSLKHFKLQEVKWEELMTLLNEIASAGPVKRSLWNSMITKFLASLPMSKIGLSVDLGHHPCPRGDDPLTVLLLDLANKLRLLGKEFTVWYPRNRKWVLLIGADYVTPEYFC